MIIILSIAVLIFGIYLYKQKANGSKSILFYIIAGGLLIGLAGLFLGVTGAIILSPGNNLAPMIGFMYTGPIGFIGGLVLGGLYWNVKVNPKNKKVESENDSEEK